MAWSTTETALLLLNVGLVTLVIWALRRKVMLKLEEVEARHRRQAEYRPASETSTEAERS